MPSAAPDYDFSSYFTVGIGASAGGLDAVSAFLSHVDFDDAAYVIVQHLSPTQRSALAEILGRHSRLRVVVAEDGVEIEKNVVYVMAPGTVLTVEGGRLRAEPTLVVSRPTMAIDVFFRSLAAQRGARAIGVVLSGTGSDGTLGLGAIKAAGGITFAQDPSTAKFDGMPRSAIESGHADFVLAPEQIADRILHISKLPYVGMEAADALSEEAFASIGAMINGAFGLDLTHYKPNTIERRIKRRMAVHRLQNAGAYVALCQTDERELANLHKDLLINVTGFFRDKEPFELLAGLVLPRIIEQKERGDVIRVWVPGCASGEEAYSIAICLLELLEGRDRDIRVQIFGTDVDAEAVQQARRGIYPAASMNNVSPERLRMYFRRVEDDHYQISRLVRDLVVFSVQNLAKDAPFSRLDLVSCRNLLIYLQPSVQKRILRVLHYALAPRGYLMLGTSESVGDSADLFTLVDRKEKLYAAKHVSMGHAVLDLGAAAPIVHGAYETKRPISGRPLVNIAQLADRKILEDYAPAGVVLNENLDIMHYRGRTGSYLEQPSGLATHNLLRLIRPELHLAVKDVIDAARAQNDGAQAEAHIRDAAGNPRPLLLIAQPLLDPGTQARCLLVMFRELDHEAREAAAERYAARVEGADTPPRGTDHAHLLTQELALTKDYLRGTIEELERANEDLKSANEELQSSNEELQSTNEELETSKEELQSTNEELITLNEELQTRMRDLGAANDDLHNLLLSVDHAIVLVGLDLRVRRFTHTAERLLNLVGADVGRTAAHLNGFLGTTDIERHIAESIERLSTVERTVTATNGRRYLVRVVPYKTLDLTVRGAVVMVIDLEPGARKAVDGD